MNRKHYEKIAIIMLLLMCLALSVQLMHRRDSGKTQLDQVHLKETNKLDDTFEQRIRDTFEERIRDRRLARKRLGIVTIHTAPYYKWANITIVNHIKYANKYGYGHYIEHGKSDPRHPVWSKLTALLAHMDEDGHDWYWALDLDSLFINGNKKAHEILDDNYDLIVQSDCNMFNAGSFMIKNSQYSREYLKKVLAIEKPSTEGLREQSAMMDVYYKDEQENKKHFKWVEQRVLNAYRDYPGFCDQTKIRGVYEKGDMLVHFPGHAGRDDFIDILKEWNSKTTDLGDDLYP